MYYVYILLPISIVVHFVFLRRFEQKDDLYCFVYQSCKLAFNQDLSNFFKTWQTKFSMNLQWNTHLLPLFLYILASLVIIYYCYIHFYLIHISYLGNKLEFYVELEKQFYKKPHNLLVQNMDTHNQKFSNVFRIWTV